MLIGMPLIAIKKWISRNHPVPLSNIKTNSSKRRASSGGNSFEMNTISIVCHPPKSSDDSAAKPIEIIEQLPNGKLCLLKVSKSQKQISKFLFEPKTNVFICISALASKMRQSKIIIDHYYAN